MVGRAQVSWPEHTVVLGLCIIIKFKMILPTLIKKNFLFFELHF